MKIISSYFGNRILKHVAKDMKQLADQGFTGVIHTFSENDYRFYSDAFKDIVEVSHDAGLDVDIDPWGVGGVFGGEAFSAWVAENPDKTQVSRDGTPRHLACLNNPEFRSFMKEWVEKAVATSANGLFWDEPHLYIPTRSDNMQSWTCVCHHCQILYTEKHGENIPKLKSPEVVEFQHLTLIDFLREMLEYGHENNIRNTVCLLPDEFTKSEPLDWQSVVELPFIDIISTDPYWKFTDQNVVDFVKKYCGRIKELVDGKGIEPQIWIQGFRIPTGEEKDVQLAIETAAAEGIENLAIWGFEACAQMSSLACGNPELVWETAVNAFNKVK